MRVELARYATAEVGNGYSLVDELSICETPLVQFASIYRSALISEICVQTMMGSQSKNNEREEYFVNVDVNFHDNYYRGKRKRQRFSVFHREIAPPM